MGLSATQRILLLAMTTNDYCTIGQTVATIPYTHNQNQWIISIFYIVAMLIKPKEIVKRRT
jgi:hypothetical protein